MMTTFIAQAIIKQAQKGIEEGKAKYYAYFENTHLYIKWQADVNAILQVEGFGELTKKI